MVPENQTQTPTTVPDVYNVSHTSRIFVERISVYTVWRLSSLKIPLGHLLYQDLKDSFYEMIYSWQQANVNMIESVIKNMYEDQRQWVGKRCCSQQVLFLLTQAKRRPRGPNPYSSYGIKYLCSLSTLSVNPIKIPEAKIALLLPSAQALDIQIQAPVQCFHRMDALQLSHSKVVQSYLEADIFRRVQ